MLSWANAQQTFLRSGMHALINSGVTSAINGGSFGKNLGGALFGEGLDLAAAAGNKGIGDLAAKLKVSPGSAQAMFLHAALGGVISVASGESFTSGAIAGGVAEGLTPVANEILAQHVSEYFNANDLREQGSQAKITTAQIIGLLSAAMAGGNPDTGNLIGGAGEKYNSQGHDDDDDDDDDSDGAMASDASGAAEELKDELDVFNDHASNGGVDLLSPIPGNGVPIVGGGGGGGAKGTISWQGSGPAPGVLALAPGSVSSKAIQNYFPNTRSGSIEFVFDPETGVFAVGKPSNNLGGSPHQQLAETIKSDGSTLVGGMFRRGANGEIITNEFSGHYWKNWSPEVRGRFEQTLKQYNLNVKHNPGM